MPKSRLLGPDGRPLTVADLSRPLAAPSLGGLRQSWRSESVASTLTPLRLAALLRDANQGDADAALTLAEEMEEREPHYAAVLGVRKRAVARLPLLVEAASEDPADQDLATALETLAQAPGLRSALFHCLDGLGKGYAVVELDWDTSGTPWLPRDRIGPSGRRQRGYRWRDPRHFRYDRETGFELRLRDAADPANGIELAPYRFLLHEPEIKSGLPIRSGLWRPAVISYMAKSFALRDWLAFSELFGLPLRLGKWGTGASEEDIARLLDAIVGLGTDGAGAIPASMSIEFIEAAKGSGGGDGVFERLAIYMDKATSKVVLGQVGTTEGQAGQLGGLSEMGDVREDIRDADAAQLTDTLAFDLVDPFIRLNYGVVDPAAMPRLHLREPDRTDAKLIADAAAALIPLGLRVDAQALRGLVGLPDPQTGTGAETIGGQGAGDGVQGAGAGQQGAVQPDMLNAYAMGIERLAGPLPVSEAFVRGMTGIPAPVGGETVLTPTTVAPMPPASPVQPVAPSLNRSSETGVPSHSSLLTPHTPPMDEPQVVLDAIAAPALADWEAQLGPVVNPILAAAAEIAAQDLDPATAYQQFVARVETLAGTLDAVDLIDTLARCTFQARGYGDAADV